MDARSGPRRIALLWDFENLGAAAKKDHSISSLRTIERADLFIRNFQEIARELGGEIVASYVAMSLQGGDGDPRDMQKYLRVVGSLVDRGATVITVPVGRDAADIALCNMGLSVVHRPEIDTVLLATEDGGEHFMELLRTAKMHDKYVAVARYDQPATRVRDIADRAFFTGSNMRLWGMQIIEGKSEERATHALQARPPAKSRIYRDAAQAIKENKPVASDAAWHLVRAAQLVKEVDRKRSRSGDHYRWSYGSVTQLFKDRLAERIGMALSDEAISDIAYVLTETSGMFQSFKNFTIVPDNEFMRKLRSYERGEMLAAVS